VNTNVNENPAEKAKVIRYVGRIIYQEQNTNTLVEKGILAKPKIYFIRCDRGDDQTVVWENSGRDYANLYKQEIVDNEYRNALIVKICSIKKNKKIIVLHEIIEHGETLLKTFEKLLPNRKIHLLSGKDNVKTRSDIIDIFEKSGNDIIIKTMVAGVKPEDLEINITRDSVTIRGKRETEKTMSDDGYFHQELYWGTFSRTISLPAEVEVEEAEAVEKHGLLIIKLPKIDKNKQAKLKVRGN
jgi:HSP20 family molecular chaperone IbpA